MADTIVKDEDGNIVPPSKRFNFRKAETYYQRECSEGLSYGERLYRDEKAWAAEVDKVFAKKSKVAGGINLRVMNMPLVLELTGAKSLPIDMNVTKMRKINKPKSLPDGHDITGAILKQLPSAIADPVMVLKPNAKATYSNARIVVTGLKDADDKTILVPIHLELQKNKYDFNLAASMYGKDNNGWLIQEIQDGNAMYVDTKNISQWLSTTRLQLPSGITIEKLSNSLPTEVDLVNMRNTSSNHRFPSLTAKPISGSLRNEPSKPTCIIFMAYIAIYRQYKQGFAAFRNFFFS
ncbi:hypothetical protein FACS1894216_21770 [Synergistales bacterium]|nr:hypothetical protein FACS1894216_21770 [Synergistales bacterium]